ncbi:glycosyltransferase [Clostridiales bacterium]|nr:glycosyltransferase [Clostridiales bacterium]
MKKVSVVVPVYNAEPFIRQCVESIASQTYPELEIILIDDGSEDKSMEICREFSSADKRIRILCQDHQGVSAARNQGLETASGEYLLFVDSDDMIHPDLAEAFVQQLEKRSADLAFCDYRKLESYKMDQARSQLFEHHDMLRWELADGAESAEWFYVKFPCVLRGIGGKMIRRNVIGTLRFDENLSKGEDTFFMYRLLDKEIHMAHLVQEWYLYRMHAASITHSLAVEKSSYYYDCYRTSRDNEYAKGQLAFAIIWERDLSSTIVNVLMKMKKAGDQEGCGFLKTQAALELKQSLFWKLDFVFKVWFVSSVFGGPLYGLLRKPYILAQKIFRKEKDEERADTGILTFHCADNYGAMLQAYGLKQYLRDMGIKAEIAAYEPPFMTGRHWWIPYMPQRNRALWQFLVSLYTWKTNLSRKQDFFRLRAKMREFRKKYLLNTWQKRIFFARQLKRLPYSYYLVGSDQIWNPDITFGLRKPYFGAFKNKRKEKVIAYGASLGGSELSSEYDQEFAGLLRYVDVISLREADAVPYVKRFCEKPLEVVLDPVFLLNQENWKQIEVLPKRSGYILLYLTEPNEELISYIKNLSQDKSLPIVELKANAGVTDKSFEVEYTAGPAEFLGLIHKADYVVTNSFHATAFSIIYQKQFVVFLHTNRGARLRNILRIHGLEDRLSQEGKNISVDTPIDWKEAERKAENAKKTSKAFLMEHVKRNI